MADSTQNQRSAELTSLTDALAKVDRMVEPVAASQQDLHAALGYTLAADAGSDGALRLAGARLRRVDIALLASLGIKQVAIRAPRVLVIRAPRASGIIDGICMLIAGAIEAEGGIAGIEHNSLEAALNHQGYDALIAVGGNSDDRDDESLRKIANLGQIEFDGIALTPGGAIAFGNARGRPVLLLPGRIEAALAVWLTIGRRLLARLSFRLIEEQPFLLELARPVSSARGFAQIVPVRRRAAQVEPTQAEPLAIEGWTPQSIARADGWILVPAESDGHPAGTKVAMRPWP
jgi:molybdopterin biosynthesis enzyme